MTFKRVVFHVHWPRSEARIIISRTAMIIIECVRTCVCACACVCVRACVCTVCV